MQAQPKQHTLTVHINDLEMEEEFQHIPKHLLWLQVWLDDKLQSQFSLNESHHPVEVHLSQNEEQRVILEVKTMEGEEELLGTIAITSDVFFAGGENKDYDQWITLFDHPDDNLYDGEMGLNDDE
jgi:hypothetical protein